MTGPRPVPLPEITVKMRRPSPIESALRIATLPPGEQREAQELFRMRREAFAHDLPRALPGGAAKMVGELGTDIASVNLPFLPALFPRVQEAGESWTSALTDEFHRLLGATPGSEGTQTGEELGGMVASALPLEAIPVLAAKGMRGVLTGKTVGPREFWQGRVTKIIPPPADIPKPPPAPMAPRGATPPLPPDLGPAVGSLPPLSRDYWLPLKDTPTGRVYNPTRHNPRENPAWQSYLRGVR